MEHVIPAEPVSEKIHKKCRRCGRKLTTPESVALGFGKVCAKRYLAETNLIPLFEVKIRGKETATTSDKKQSNTGILKASKGTGKKQINPVRRKGNVSSFSNGVT